MHRKLLVTLTTICLLLLAKASVWAAAINIFAVAGVVHDSSGLVAQLDDTSASFFSTLNANNLGTFGWTFTNTTGNALTNVRFFGFLDADIDEPLNTSANEFGAFVSLALPPGAPVGSIAASSWEIDEPGFSFGNIFANVQAGALDNSNGVPSGAPDDVALALGFSVGTLGVNQQVKATFRLSDTNIGGLQQVDPDSNVQFWFNGSIETSPVPEPGTGMLIGSVLLGWFGFTCWQRKESKARPSEPVLV